MSTHLAVSDGHSANTSGGEFYAATANYVLCACDTTESAKRIPVWIFDVDIATDRADDVDVTAATITLKTDEQGDKWDDLDATIYAEEAWRDSFANWQLRSLPSSWSSRYATTITAGIDSDDLSFTIASATGWPTSNFFAELDYGGGSVEWVRCTSRSGTTVTVASGGRGQYGTTAASHSSGAGVRLVNSDVWERYQTSNPTRRTSASVAWSFTEAGANTLKTSPSIVSVLQEVIDLALADNTAVERLCVLAMPASSTAADKDGSFWSVEAADADAVEAELSITVTVSITVAAAASTDLSASAALTVTSGGAVTFAAAATTDLSAAAVAAVSRPLAGAPSADLSAAAALEVSGQVTFAAASAIDLSATAALVRSAPMTGTVSAALAATGQVIRTARLAGVSTLLILDRTTDVVVWTIGDSWAEMIGQSSTGGDIGKTMRGQLCDRLAGKGVAVPAIANYAVRGSRAGEWESGTADPSEADSGQHFPRPPIPKAAFLAALGAHVGAGKANVVVVSLGANDIAQPSWSNTYDLADPTDWDTNAFSVLETDVSALIDDILAVDSSAVILMPSYTNWGFSRAWFLTTCGDQYNTPCPGNDVDCVSIFQATANADMTDERINKLSRDYMQPHFADIDAAYSQVKAFDLWGFAGPFDLEPGTNYWDRSDESKWGGFCDVHLTTVGYEEWTDFWLDAWLPTTTIFDSSTALGATRALAASTTTDISASAGLTVTTSLAGSALTDLPATAGLSVTRTCAAAVTMDLGAVSATSALRPLGAAATADLAAAAAVATTRPLEAAVGVDLSATSALSVSGQIALAGLAAADLSASAGLSVSRPLTASSTTAADTAAALGATRPLTASSASSVTATADLDVTTDVTFAAVGTTDLSASPALGVTRDIATTAAAALDASPALGATRVVSGSVTTSLTVTADTAASRSLGAGPTLDVSAAVSLEVSSGVSFAASLSVTLSATAAPAAARVLTATTTLGLVATAPADAARALAADASAALGATAALSVAGTAAVITAAVIRAAYGAVLRGVTVMSSTITIAAASTENVTVDIDSAEDPSTATVELAVVGLGDDATDDDFAAAVWAGDAAELADGTWRRTATLLVGPGSAFGALPAGHYEVAARITNGAELAHVTAGALRIT